MSAVVLFVLFFVILLFGLPISVTMGISSILPWVVDNTFAANLVMVLRQMMSGVNSLTLLAIPMFMLSGTIMARGGISKKLFDVFTYFVGNVIGGVPCAVIITCLFYGAISGSAPATVAAVGAMTIPVMVNLGYSKEFSTAVVTVAGGLGCIIPPSIPFVLYSTSAGTSVGDMFIAGIVPGLLLGGLLMIYAVYYSARRGEDRVRIKAVMGELRGQGFLRLFLYKMYACHTADYQYQKRSNGNPDFFHLFLFHMVLLFLILLIIKTDVPSPVRLPVWFSQFQLQFSGCSLQHRNA